jgi:ATP-binding cassette subfamily B protein
MPSFPHYSQLNEMDCGPACLRMVAKYYGKHYSLQKLRELSFITREGVSLLGLSHAAEKIGMKSLIWMVNQNPPFYRKISGVWVKFHW